MTTALSAPEVRFDVASAMSQGGRDYQEDALATDFAIGSQIGLAVLADGMGGHVAGDVASQIAVTEIFSDLKLRMATPDAFREDIPGHLASAVLAANTCLGNHCQAHPESSGMGATVVSLVMDGTQLYWISVGDSPLYLFRAGELRQLNEDHSLAPQIDYLVAQGLMDAETGRNHPDRHCLTSVLIGGEIERVDCRTEPFELRPGDTLVVSSDGLQSMTDAQIAETLFTSGDLPASAVAERLLAGVMEVGDPDQDNVSFAVIRVTPAFRRPKRAERSNRPATPRPPRSKATTTIAAMVPNRQESWLERGYTYILGHKPAGRETS